MRTGFFYLNNSGTKFTPSPKDKVRLIHPSANYDKIRTISFYSSFGNFSAAHIKYKGKMISVLLDGTDKDGNRVAFVDYKDKIEY